MASELSSIVCRLEIGDECKSHSAVEVYWSSELEVAETATAFEHMVEVLGNGFGMKCRKAGHMGWGTLRGNRRDYTKGPFGVESVLDDHTYLNSSSVRKVLLDQTSDVVEEEEIGRKVSYCFLFRI
jgi:hypothetical protein